jgi:hypothetical protein
MMHPKVAVGPSLRFNAEMQKAYENTKWKAGDQR